MLDTPRENTKGFVRWTCRRRSIWCHGIHAGISDSQTLYVMKKFFAPSFEKCRVFLKKFPKKKKKETIDEHIQRLSVFDFDDDADSDTHPGVDHISYLDHRDVQTFKFSPSTQIKWHFSPSSTRQRVNSSLYHGPWSTAKPTPHPHCSNSGCRLWSCRKGSRFG